MGAIANAVLETKGKVIGVIPKVLVEWEQQHNDITELFVVDDMHIRKKMIYEKKFAMPFTIGIYNNSCVLR